MSTVRPPAVAGAFYPADPAVLASTVDKLLDAVDVPGDDVLARGYVVPHAGYRYSGPTAAHVYARLRRHAVHIGRIVLLGPAHRVRVKGIAVPTTPLWATPLGDVTIDLGNAKDLPADDAPHAPEHSLEVQLPFLQRAVPGVPVLPFVAGVSTVEEVADAVASTAGDQAVVLCSTDFSHYETDDAARVQDERTAQAVESHRPDLIGVKDACGVFALRGTVEWARRNALKPRRLALTTSADTSGDRSRVVGYPAFALG